MTARRISRLAVAAAVLCGSVLSAHAFVQRRAASGAPFHWRNPGAIQYVVDRVGSRDIPSDGGRELVRFAFAWWSMDPHSTLRMTLAPGPARDLTMVQDGVNAVAWIEDPNFEGLTADALGSTRMYVDAETGEIYEADIWLNGVNYSWSSLWSDAPSAASGPAYVQAVMTRLIGFFIGLDHSVNPDATMFPALHIDPSEAIYIKPEDEAAVRTIYPASAFSDTVLAGHVSRPTGPIEGAYVTVHEVETGASYGAVTDASGGYAIHLLRAGQYRVRVQPYTTDPRITLSPYYRALSPSNLDFLAVERATPVLLSPGQSLDGIDFTVSASGSIDDPYEPDGTQALARPIATDGTPQVHHAWSASASPAHDEDWLSFVSQPGHLYIIDTDMTGHSIANFGAATPVLARTSLRLQAGGILLAENGSRDPFVLDNRSRITFLETQGVRTLTVRVSMRDADAVGAGYYYDVAVTDVPPPLSLPHVDAARPSKGSYSGGYVIVLQGSGFAPGSQVSIGGAAGLVESVDDCDHHYSCSAIKVLVPQHAPGTVAVVVTSPDGGIATLGSGFTYLAPIPGAYEDGWAGAFASLTPHYLGYGQAACFGDYDNDGWVDLFRGADPPAGYPGNILLHNQRGTFTDVTAGAFGVLPLFITSCAWGDYDNDGWADLIVVNNGGANTLHHNDRDGTFSEGSMRSSGGFDAAWFDYDHDGCLDLFVAQSLPSGKNELWKNQCNASFVNVAPSLGLDVSRHTARVAIHDFDGDGWDDIYLANWSGTADILYHNRGGASFVDATAASGISETRQCADAKVADLNGDNFPDILCSGDTRGTNDSYKPPLWINDGTGHFTNHAQAAGLWNSQRYCNAATVFDRDNDGVEDVYFGCEQAYFPPHTSEELDMLLANDGAGNPVFTDVTLAAGITEYQYPRTAWATAAADVDRDGDHDLYVTGDTEAITGVVPDDSDYFWRNTTNAPWERSPARDWIKIGLRGGMSSSGSAHLSPAWGEGAKVTVVYDFKQPGGAIPTEGECLTGPLPAGARAVTREMVGGSHGQNQMELLFGLGAPRPAGQRYVDCVIVDWPSGLRRAYTRLAVNSYVEVSEATDSLDLLSVTPASGPVAGSTALQLAGFNFAAGAHVLLGNVSALSVSVVSEHLITCTAPAHAPGRVNVTVVNPDGTRDTIVDGYAYVLPVGNIDVVDPNPLLLNGPAVSSNLTVLGSTTARGVFGFAADGVTPVVLRLPVPSAGLVDFSVYDEARRTTNIGTLRAPSSPSAGPTVTVPTTPIGSQHMGIAILRAPDSFWRDAGDDQAALRPITIEATFRPASGGSTLVASTFYIVRPPVLLLHGIWTSAKTWGWALMNDPRYVVFAHNYGPTSDQSFYKNKRQPAVGAQHALDNFRHRGLAGTKVAVFGHSMGGNLSRLHASGLRTDYVRDDNFGSGDFYFLVTVDTAHKGSPVADAGIALRDDSPLGHDLEVGMDRLGMNIRNGAVWDFQTTSYEMTHLPAANLPVHAFASVGGSDLLAAGLEFMTPAPVKLMLGAALDYGAVFPPELQHDFVVGRQSQEGGIDRTTLFHYVDSENKAIHFNSVTRESNPNDRAIELMNTPLADTGVWAPGFPAATTGTVSTETEEAVGRHAGATVAAWALAGDPRDFFDGLRDAERRARDARLGGHHRDHVSRSDSVFQQGETVQVTVQPGGGFAPSRMLVIAAEGDTALLRAEPWSAQLQISQDVLGASSIWAWAIDANNASATAEIPIRVAATSAELTDMSVTPDEIGLFAAALQAQLEVSGQFSDGVERDITAAAHGTTYDSLNRSVVTVSSDGLMTGVRIGSTTVVVRNGAKQVNVSVRVKSLPLALTFAGKTILAWPGDPGAVGYDVVTGNLGQLRASNGNFTNAVSGCIARDIPETTANVTASPATGNGFFYLLRFRRPGGPASYDEFHDWMENQVGNRDAEIAASAGACAP